MTFILYAVSRGVPSHWLMSKYWGSGNAARISDTVCIWWEQNGLLMEQGYCTSHNRMLKLLIEKLAYIDFCFGNGIVKQQQTYRWTWVFARRIKSRSYGKGWSCSS